jgi:hypothetical protein
VSPAPAAVGIETSSSAGTAFVASTSRDGHPSVAASFAPSPEYEAVTFQTPTLVGVNATLYGPGPSTVATCVSAGAAQPESPGPNTLNVSVPLGRKPLTTLTSNEASVPTVTRFPDVGTESDGLASRTSMNAGPHATLDGVLFASPG